MSPALAQTPLVEVVFSSPPSPVGAGARATGVGSAFIAVADDATAASWNPGGLTQLEKPEFSAVGRGIHQMDQVGSGSKTVLLNGEEQTFGVDGQNDSFSTASLNYLSAAIPFTFLDRNVVASLNYQQMLSFDRDLHFRVDNHDPTSEIDSHFQNHLLQTGGVDAVTGAVAVEATPELSLGAAFNYWIDGLSHPFAWQETFSNTGAIVFSDGSTIPIESIGRDIFEHFRGANGTLGLLWKVEPNLSFGAVWKWPFTAHVNHLVLDLENPSAPPLRYRHRIQFPASYGLGLSWRPVDRLTVSADATYVDWEHFRVVDSSGSEFLVTGDPALGHSVSGIFTPRIGVEYLWLLESCTLATRGGLFYDPEPAQDGSTPYYGGSVGLGLTLSTFSIDFAYQLRFGLNSTNTSVTTQLLDVPGVPIDTFQNLFYLSIVKYF